MAGKSSRFGLFAVLCLLVTLPAFADRVPITIESAEKLVLEKKYEQAQAVYEEWLKANPKDPRLYEILLRWGELTKNAFRCIEVYEAYLPNITDPAKKTALQKQIALLYVMLGDYKNARAWYTKAFFDLKNSADDPYFLEPARLSLISGDVEAALAWVKTAYPVCRTESLKLEALYLLLEIAIQRDDIAYALDVLSMLKKDDTKGKVFPRALFRLAVYYYLKKDMDKARGFSAELEKSFSGSPEALAAASVVSGKLSQVQAMTLPHELLGDKPMVSATGPADTGNTGTQQVQPQPQPVPVQPQPVQPQPTPGPVAVAADKGLRIQIGSYTMLENAQYALRDAEKLGFKGEIVKKIIRDQTYFRVIIGSNLTEAEAQKLLATLSDHGISGILYTDVD